eukprot:CAMPEP_0197926124 /NCGR_PEP_ID=MMETSP1439-20131203/98631_1 /TAXON_ID=66791 /ORGANISM="Gonyaulax spinifera, Strain CCMP409" /LENGTH=278 /DNA_ID=CAMNT_0043548647 /DNA_START=79 /DNA_END=912 /DNA_ORIENTATION=+
MRLLLLALGVAQLPGSLGGYTPPTKYLLISNARNGTIGYVKVPPGENASEVMTLIDKGLGHPQGIAVDQKRQLLIIADSALKKVVSYGLTLNSDGTLAVDEQTPLAEDVESRWVAVDGPGNVYFTDEQGNRILRITAAQVFDGDTVAQAVLPSTAQSAVSAPGGVASDNFHIYWANKMNGKSAGTIVRSLGPGPNRTDVDTSGAVPLKLASNEEKAYGVCVAIDNVYFTAPDARVYGVKTTGGSPTIITNALKNPRGCIWDGDSTIYVADRSANGVFA